MVEQLLRALLISQDEHEIFLTLASFTDVYLKYLEGTRRRLPAQQDLLRMQQYGPWTIDLADDMDHFAKVILAFVLKASDGL